jgi:DNA-binding CsgD family transcriptional regulator
MTARHVLTDAERRAAALAARGRTNREIAAELELSHKTVESHLSRVYRKLNVRSRTELAARFVSREIP